MSGPSISIMRKEEGGGDCEGALCVLRLAQPAVLSTYGLLNAQRPSHWLAGWLAH